MKLNIIVTITITIVYHLFRQLYIILTIEVISAIVLKTL